MSGITVIRIGVHPENPDRLDEVGHPDERGRGILMHDETRGEPERNRREDLHRERGHLPVSAAIIPGSALTLSSSSHSGLTTAPAATSASATA